MLERTARKRRPFVLHVQAIAALLLGLALGLIAHRTDPVRRSAVTSRQREVLLLVGSGLTTKEIAVRLRISEASVRTHIRRARARLGAPNRAAAVAALAETPWPEQPAVLRSVHDRAHPTRGREAV